jgi:hypothetical protein
MPNLERVNLFSKAPSGFCRNLAVCHLPSLLLI